MILINGNSKRYLLKQKWRFSMNKKFLAGLATGLTSSLLILSICLSIFVWWQNDKLDEKNSDYDQLVSSNEEMSQLKETTANVNFGEINAKINLLEKYVDAYFLNDVDKTKIADGIYKGFIYSLNDPYSTYYTAKEYQSLMDSTTGSYYGIGATVSQNINTGIITIVKPFVDSPSYKAGILPGDILYKVSGKEVTGEDLTAVVSQMKGEEGTTVDIEVVREGEKEPLQFTVTRENIIVQTVEYEKLKNDIGYIAISAFDEVTSKQFCDAVDDLEEQGINGLVIDLRNNGGGVLDTAVEMLDRLLPEGIVTFTKDKNGEGKEYTSSNAQSFDKPLAVLINESSASASELFAGAIQDYEAGTIVGNTSYGKGIVQSVIPLSDGSAIKLTSSKYYTPKGRNIHGDGIKPDVEVDLEEELYKKVIIEKEEDNQLQRAIEEIEKKLE